MAPKAPAGVLCLYMPRALLVLLALFVDAAAAPVKALPGWVWNKSKISPDPTDWPDLPTSARNYMKGVERINNIGCPHWNGYYWPMAAFWSTEFVKRMQRVDWNNETQRKEFVVMYSQAAILQCMPKVDPRDGFDFSWDSSVYYKHVALNTDIKIPKMPQFPWFGKQNGEDLRSHIGCMWWSMNMMCDLAWWAKKLKGNKQYGGADLCWDKVPHPEYSFTASYHVDQNFRAFPDPLVEQRIHPEYSLCLEHELNDTVLDKLCPMGGHLEDGSFGWDYWGDGIEDEEGQKEIIECQARAGIPIEHFGDDFPEWWYPWSKGVELW